MKPPSTIAIAAIAVALLVSGCVSLPPVVQVKHESNAEVLQRLDAINNRLDRLEKQANDQLREDLRVLKSEVNSLKAAEGE